MPHIAIRRVECIQRRCRARIDGQSIGSKNVAGLVANAGVGIRNGCHIVTVVAHHVRGQAVGGVHRARQGDWPGTDAGVGLLESVIPIDDPRAKSGQGVRQREGCAVVAVGPVEGQQGRRRTRIDRHQIGAGDVVGNGRAMGVRQDDDPVIMIRRCVRKHVCRIENAVWNGQIIGVGNGLNWNHKLGYNRIILLGRNGLCVIGKSIRPSDRPRPDTSQVSLHGG